MQDNLEPVVTIRGRLRSLVKFIRKELKELYKSYIEYAKSVEW